MIRFAIIIGVFSYIAYNVMKIGVEKHAFSSPFHVLTFMAICVIGLVSITKYMT